VKKSNKVILSVVLLSAIAGCQQKDEWISGNENGTRRDTTLHGGYYRFFGGFWYPVVNGLISPRSYQGANTAQISRPGYTPSKVRTGGFGRSSRSATS
jgi:hypothetical protein